MAVGQQSGPFSVEDLLFSVLDFLAMRFAGWTEASKQGSGAMGLGRCGEARLPCVWGKEVQVIADSSLPAHFISTRQHDQQRRAAAAEAVRGPKLLAEPCHRRCSARAPQLPASTRRRSIDGGRRPDQASPSPLLSSSISVFVPLCVVGVAVYTR
jgi:hypothetical protein